ncbi:hypothetical protein [Rhodanobacter lindaniclasticus]
MRFFFASSFKAVRRRSPATTSYCSPSVRIEDQVLQQADAGNARGQFGDGLAWGRADVALGAARQQLREGNQDQVLGRVGHFQWRGGFDGDGFGFEYGVHGDNSLQVRDAAAKEAARAAACPCRVGIQAFNWRRPSASSHRARFRRTLWSMPCTGRVV